MTKRLLSPHGRSHNFEIYVWTDIFGLWKLLSLLDRCWPNCVLKSMIIFLSQINRRSSSRLTKEKVPLHVITFYQGRGGRLLKFAYQNHPTKVDVTSGQICAQQPASAKSNDGVRVRHDFFGFLSHRYQELWTVDMKDVVKILLRLHEQGFSKGVIFSIVLTENTRQLSVVSWRKFHTLKTSGVQTFGSCGFWSFESWNFNSLSRVQHNGGDIVSHSLPC